MPSPLSFNSTEDFRKKLLVRNLPPFNSDGFNPTTNPGQSELELTNFSVVDSAEVEEIGDVEEVRLYINNQYGPEGGYDDRYSVQDVQKLVTKREEYFKFVASVYNPVRILFDDNPQGSDGTVSQDSSLMQIAAKSLRTEFEYRVAEELQQETVGRLNFLSALKDPFIAGDIIRGKQELIEPDWNISVPNNIVAKGLDYISRLSGVYVPYSWIPGDYFSNTPRKLFVNQAINKVTGIFTDKFKLPTEKTGMQTFLDNTGGGQKSTLLKSLDLNRYGPSYNKGLLNNLKDDIVSFFTGDDTVQGFYVGDKKSDPSLADSPPGSLPVNRDGLQVMAAVYGYGTLGFDYEGGKRFKFGLGTVEPGDGPDLQGGFTWTSTGTEGAASQELSTYAGTVSTNYQFTPGSILDNTQKLIDAADASTNPLQHVGTAINQVSRVFHDGTREITKGSRVKTYVTEGGREVGKEYCRIFTKDTPYYNMSRLQKKDGNIRKFESSVLTNTYDLNIAPQKLGGIPQNFGQRGGENITKYMLSLENLAWRTSGLQQDLPECEKGPMGGRIMWFPPYDLRVDETISARWQTNDFLGRPEPVYTYSNTQRQGSLSFKIIVDHPSVLNTLVKKELKSAVEYPDSEVNKIVDSFFSGCKTLDIYDLVKKYGQFSFNDIYEVVTKTNNQETYKLAYEEIPREEPIVNSTPPNNDVVKPTLDTDYLGMSLYFDNDYPEGSTNTEVTSDYKYEHYLNNYKKQKSTYITQAKKFSGQTQVESFFDDEITNSLESLNDFINDAVKAAKEGYTVNIELTGSASAPNSKEYNINLSKRRNDSVKKQILENKSVIDVNAGSKGKIAVVKTDAKGEQTGDCSEPFTGSLSAETKVYSIRAMGCRTTKISKISLIEPKQVEQPEPTDETVDKSVQPLEPTGEPKIEKGPGITVETQDLELKKDITKKLIRRMLTECDYFEKITEDTSFLYEGIREKVKYFNPAFHSITPEGLNSRLTFLQQCLRPGDTIPTIGPDGNPLKNDALNTSFGTPPICVLRVGDFWHTKIAINQLSLRYEPLNLDLNPEGIGVQPMLAEVSLSFFFIGGHGIKEPVQKLQNALSFNYYANTEMYDERAEATYDTSELDENFVEGLSFDTPFSIKNANVENPKDGSEPIGTITRQELETTTGNTLPSISGDINYKSIMNDLLGKNTEYQETVIASLQCIADFYGELGMRLYTTDRKYTSGDFVLSDTLPPDTAILYGKSFGLDQKFETQFQKCNTDIDNDVFPLIPSNTKKYKRKDIKKYKKKLKEIVEVVKSGFVSPMNVESQKLVDKELELTNLLDKVNVVATKIDGIINDKGNPVVYRLTGTSEVFDTSVRKFSDTYQEMMFDYFLILENMNSYDAMLDIYDLVSTNSSLKYDNDLNTVIETSSISTEPEKRFYLLFFNQILNNQDYLRKELFTFIETNDFYKKDEWKINVLEILSAQEVKFKKAQDDIQKLFNRVNNEYTLFESDTLYSKEKIRKFTFSNDDSAADSEKNKIKYLYDGLNHGEPKKWNNKVKLQ